MRRWRRRCSHPVWFPFGWLDGEMWACIECGHTRRRLPTQRENATVASTAEPEHYDGSTEATE